MKQPRQPVVPDDENTTPWALQFWATSQAEPGRLVQLLTGAVLGCGGWVLSRGMSDSGSIHMAIEFERRSCVEVYSVLVATGLNLSHAGHCSMTELCQCTRLNTFDCGGDVVSIDLEIETSLPDLHARGPSNSF